jgi:hypothetical protein
MANLKSENVIIGKERSPTIEIEMVPTSRGCYSGVKKFEMNGKFYFLKQVLMPEAIGKVFETEKTEKEHEKVIAKKD